MTLTNYTDDVLRHQATGPSQAALIDQATRLALAKKGPVVASAETMLSNAREKYLPLLEALSGETCAREDIAVLASLLVR